MNVINKNTEQYVIGYRVDEKEYFYPYKDTNSPYVAKKFQFDYGKNEIVDFDGETVFSPVSFDSDGNGYVELTRTMSVDEFKYKDLVCIKVLWYRS